MKHLYLTLLGIGLGATTLFAQYDATITVTDLSTGLPLQDAEVVFDGNFQNTDAAGMAVFTDLIDFDYSYTVSKGCYTANSGILTIAGADNSDAITLEPTTSNNVFFFVGSPMTIAGATVTLTDNANYNETLETGAPFGDLFENVPFGEYSYSVTIPCYEPLSGNVTVDCSGNGDGIALFLEPVALTANNVFFFVGSPITIAGATVTLTDGADYNETLETGAPFGDLFENVPFGEYSYSVTIPCYEPLSGNVMVDCTGNGDGIALFLEPAEVVIDATVTLASGTLTAMESGLDYQWVDCDDNNAPIIDATEQSFTATESGSYAVIVTNGDCSQTSVCTAVIVSGVEDRTSQNAYTVYPNPFNENLTVRSNGQSGTVHIELINMAGKVLINETRTGMELITLATEQLAPGSYVVRLTSANESTTFSVIK